ncbi:hypothetical protein HN928_07060, partial [bacterium]|nr:hypothetical protein [bacterium]
MYKIVALSQIGRLSDRLLAQLISYLPPSSGVALSGTVRRLNSIFYGIRPERIDLSDINFNEHGFQELMSLVQAGAMGRLDKVKFLDLSGSTGLDLPLSQIIVPDKDIDRIARRYPYGMSISDLLNIKNPNTTVLDFILQQVPTNLPHLNLSGCYLTDASVEAIVRACPELRSLNLSGCTELRNPQIKLKLLTHLDLSGCYDLTDAAIQAIVENCPNLINLNLNRCHQITDATVGIIAKNCPKLKSLNLNGCNLKAPHIKSKSLTHLTLKGCHQITDEAIQAIAENCPNLISLDLNGCHQITDETIKAIAKYCPKLRNLNLSGCSNLTDATVGIIA